MIEQITQKDKRYKREGAGEVRTAGGGSTTRHTYKTGAGADAIHKKPFPTAPEQWMRGPEKKRSLLGKNPQTNLYVATKACSPLPSIIPPICCPIAGPYGPIDAKMFLVFFCSP